MKYYAELHAPFFIEDKFSFDEKLAAYYYDAGRVYYQIGEYLENPVWISIANKAVIFYRDKYVNPNNGQVPGYWNFSEGLLRSYRTLAMGDTKTAIENLSLRAAFAPPTTPIQDTEPSTLSREVAYNILTSLSAEKIGLPKAEHYAIWVDQAFGHINQWFINKTAPYIRPFMVALTMEALIESKNESALEAGIIACNYMWKNMWLPCEKAFMYTNITTPEGGVEPAPDLNLLICPLYAWVYKETKDKKYLEMADAIFSGGVEKAYLGSPKQFNQNYRWSFKYLEWRKEGDSDHSREYEVEFPPGTLECSNYFLKQIRDLLATIDNGIDGVGERLDSMHDTLLVR